MRVERGKRALNPGALRPDIVLYDEAHPRADKITNIKTHDLIYGNLNLFLILGIRLRIKGVKDMVKEFARSVYEKDKLVVYVNLIASKAKEWDGIIDYWVEWDCDSWVKDLKMRNPEWSLLVSRRKDFRKDSVIFDAQDLISSKKRRRDTLRISPKRRNTGQSSRNFLTGSKGEDGASTASFHIKTISRHDAEREGQRPGSTAEFSIDLTC